MAYTSNRKPSALNAATSVAAGNEIVVSQAGVVNKATMTQVENFIFSAKTSGTNPANGDIVVIRRGSDIRQLPVENILPTGSVTNAMLGGSIADSKLNTISTAGKVANSATTATNANTNNAIVARDGSGNFTAGTITATLAGSITGNAATATNLSSNRTFALTGNVTGSANSNLSSGVSIATTIPNGTVTSAMIVDGTIVNDDINTSAAIVDTKLATINTAGKVTNNAVQAVSTNTANRIVTRDASGNFAAGNITATLTGNSSTATTLATARTIALTGDISGITGSFNGSANVSAETTLANSGVVAGTYNNNAAQVRPFTVDAKGRVTNVGTAIPIALDYSVISGTPHKNNVRLATTTNLTAVYANGSSGVGATLTNNGTLGALSVDGTAVVLNDRVLVKNQTTAAQNGIYTVTNTGSSVAAWVLTRATDADQNTKIGGAVVIASLGTTNGSKFFTTDFRGNDTVGTTAQNWSQIVTTGDTATVSEVMLASNSVTNTKLRDSAGLSVIGRSTDSSGDPADIAAATDGHVLRRAGTALGFGTIASAGIADGAVTNAKFAGSVGLNAWQTRTANHTAVAGDRINANTSGSAFTITLPSSPATYAEVTLADHAGTWGTNNLTVARNGQNINGGAADLICDVSAKQITLRFEPSPGGGSAGWRIYT